jgi:lysophospholipase
MLSVVAPRARFQSRVDPRKITSCPLALERRLNDALMHRTVTARWFFAMRAGLQSAWKAAGQINTPILILQAGADEIVVPKAPELWLSQVASPDATLHSFPGHLHELLNEPDWANTAGLISQWLSQRFASQHIPLACEA